MNFQVKLVFTIISTSNPMLLGDPKAGRARRRSGAKVAWRIPVDSETNGHPVCKAVQHPDCKLMPLPRGHQACPPSPPHGSEQGHRAARRAPGLRLGYAVAPKDVHLWLALATQASDLQPSTFAPQLYAEIQKAGFLQRHAASKRVRYETHRTATQAAPSREFGGDGSDGDAALQWNFPAGVGSSRSVCRADRRRAPCS